MNFFLKEHNKWTIMGLSLIMLIVVMLLGAVQRERALNAPADEETTVEETLETTEE